MRDLELCRPRNLWLCVVNTIEHGFMLQRTDVIGLEDLICTWLAIYYFAGFQPCLITYSGSQVHLKLPVA